MSKRLETKTTFRPERLLSRIGLPTRQISGVQKRRAKCSYPSTFISHRWILGSIRGCCCVRNSSCYKVDLYSKPLESAESMRLFDQPADIPQRTLGFFGMAKDNNPGLEPRYDTKNLKKTDSSDINNSVLSTSSGSVLDSFSEYVGDETKKQLPSFATLNWWLKQQEEEKTQVVSSEEGRGNLSDSYQSKRNMGATKIQECNEMRREKRKGSQEAISMTELEINPSTGSQFTNEGVNSTQGGTRTVQTQADSLLQTCNTDVEGKCKGASDIITEKLVPVSDTGSTFEQVNKGQVDREKFQGSSSPREASSVYLYGVNNESDSKRNILYPAERPKSKRKSLSSNISSTDSSGSCKNPNSKKDEIPFDIHEAERYTSSKPHLSAAALQCATMAASELQSELKATEEMLNSAARRRRYSSFTYGDVIGNIGSTKKDKPDTNDPLDNHVSGPNATVEIGEHVSPGVHMENVPINERAVSFSLPERNLLHDLGTEGSSSANQSFLLCTFQEIVRKLANAESQVRVLRSRNSELIEERDLLLVENENLKAKLKRMSTHDLK
eukprot:jgi/Galph1/1180/GphlegSOOS_G6109.1